jgi:acyl-CoA thioesterase I
MKDDVVSLTSAARTSRRRWLAHCSLSVLSLAVAGRAAGATAKRTPARILVLGDSLSAEYGLARGTGWVSLMERKLQQEGVAAQVVNASISGETTSGGRARLPTLLTEHRPTHVVIELGGNDALRGLPLTMTRKNLVEMTRASRAAGARVVMVGMRLPPNYGRRYGEDFMALYEQVAQDHDAALVPWFLKGVADGPRAAALFQPDRIHPTAEAQPMMLDNVWPVLRELLR